MHKKDYIQRQFEEFGKVLASILSRKKKKEWEEFEKEIEQASQKFAALEIAQLENLSTDDFNKQIQSSSLLYDQKKILANLFFEKMNAYFEKAENEKYQSAKSKCIALYSHLSADLTQNEFDLEVHYRIKLLGKI